MQNAENEQVSQKHYTLGLNRYEGREMTPTELSKVQEVMMTLDGEKFLSDKIYDGYLPYHGIVQCDYDGHECYITVGPELDIHHWKVILGMRLMSVYNTRTALGTEPVKLGGRRDIRRKKMAFNGILGDIKLLIEGLLENEKLPERIAFDAEMLLKNVRFIQRELR